MLLLCPSLKASARFCFWLSLLVISFGSVASTNGQSENLNQQQAVNAEKFFQDRIQTVFTTLVKEKHRFQNPAELKAFAESNLVDYWDIEATLLSMLGRTLWTELSSKQQMELLKEFKLTLTRYFMEAYGLYTGQPIALKQLMLNSDGSKGWLIINVEMDYLPDLQIDIKIKKHNEKWLFQDLRFHGLLYSSLKRDWYQGTLRQQGFDTLINQLKEKNDNFFNQLQLAKVGIH